MKVLVFVDHDIVVRHFIHSRIFEPLTERHHVVVVVPEEGNKRVKMELGPQVIGNASLRRLPVVEARQRIWQGLMLADNLRWRPGVHHAAMRRFHRHAAGRKASWIHSVISVPGIFQSFRKWSLFRIRQTPNHQLERMLDEERPDLIIHPTVLAGVYVNDLGMASRRRGIPLVMIMNSWDNPSTKRAMTGKPDWLLVWGPQTQAHAVKYIGMQKTRAVCFGAAQFDVFRMSPRITRSDFCRNHQISENAKILLYAGSSKGTDEFAHLVMIDNAIESGQLGDVVVVYRPHPWGGAGAGGHRILDHPWKHVRIESSMRSYLERLRHGKPGITTPDYRDTHDVLSSVDFLVSPLSTIIIEGALHGKPVMCFLPSTAGSDRHFELTLPLTHFDDLFDEPCFLVARGDGELIDRLNQLLKLVGNADFERDLRMACDHFVTSFDRPYGERLVEFVESIVPGKNHE